MSTHTDDKRYRNELIAALRWRNVSGVRIGEIVAEVEAHTAESGQSAFESFGPPKEYAKQFEPTPGGGRRWGQGAWVGTIAAALGGWLLAAGVTAGMVGEEEFGIPGWWAAAIGAVLMIGTFCFMPIDAIIDPRRPNAQRYGRVWMVGVVTGSTAVIVLLLMGLMALTR